MKILLIYFLIVNIVAFLFAGYDKNLAIRKKRRIPENTLFLLATIGGSIGLLLAMLVFRHKTSKSSFIIKFGVIFIIQIVVFVFLLKDKI